MDLNPEIFREYDIRGRVDVDLTDETVETIARAAAAYLKQHGSAKVSLASDNRLSSDRFRAIVARALAGSGLDVVDFGVIPSPVFYFTLFEYGTDGGIMITGSHNPPEFNGFKVAMGRSTIYGDEIQRVRQIAEARKFMAGRGSVDEADAKGAYIDNLCRRVSIPRDLRVAADCGNGTAGLDRKSVV
jgi:phosphomannomutase/phosphoglucomutase